MYLWELVTRMGFCVQKIRVYYGLTIYKTHSVDQCVNSLAVSHIFLIKWSSFQCIIVVVHFLFLSSWIANRAAFSFQPFPLVSPLFFRLEIGNSLKIAVHCPNPCLVIPSFRKSSSSFVNFKTWRMFLWERKILLGRASCLGRSWYFALSQLRARPRTSILRVLRGRPRPLLNPWHLEVSVGTRDPSKQFHGIVAFDSEL